MERRLVAILAADMVGYSRLMAADELGTIDRQKLHRSQLIDPKIAQYGGRIVKTTGDGLLVEFPSVVDAVQCAVEIQRTMPEREREQAEPRRISYRIGINLGDIVIDGDDILGDGVNVAARLEGVAPPGGLCVSDTVHQSVKGKLAVPFEDAGEQSLKNLDRRLRVWRWLPVATAVLTPGATPSRPLLADKPSVAVLPLANMSGDPEQEYFTDGLTEDLITELSRFQSLHVIARNSSFVFKGQPVDVGEVSRRLGVSHVIEGSVRKAAGRVRVTAQLIEAQSGTHLWAERYDRDLADVFAVQDEIVRAIVKMVAGRIEATRRSRVAMHGEHRVAAYDCLLRGKVLVMHVDRANIPEARRWLTRAAELDPLSAEPPALLALTYLMEWMAHWVADRPAAFARGLELAEKAVQLDDNSTRGNWALGQMNLFDRQYEKARFYLERAIRLNPNEPEARGIYGYYLSAIGEHSKAIEQFERAMQVDPYDLSWLPWLKGIAHFAARQYVEAAASLERVELGIAEVAGWLAASYAMQGRTEDARCSLDAFFLRNDSAMPAPLPRRLSAWQGYWAAAMPFRHHADVEHLNEALRKAGFPDGDAGPV